MKVSPYFTGILKYKQLQTRIYITELYVQVSRLSPSFWVVNLHRLVGNYQCLARICHNNPHTHENLVSQTTFYFHSQAPFVKSHLCSFFNLLFNTFCSRFNNTALQYVWFVESLPVQQHKVCWLHPVGHQAGLASGQTHTGGMPVHLYCYADLPWILGEKSVA